MSVVLRRLRNSLASIPDSVFYRRTESLAFEEAQQIGPLYQCNQLFFVHPLLLVTLNRISKKLAAIDKSIPVQLGYKREPLTLIKSLLSISAAVTAQHVTHIVHVMKHTTNISSLVMIHSIHDVVFIEEV